MVHNSPTQALGFRRHKQVLGTDTDTANHRNLSRSRCRNRTVDMVAATVGVVGMVIPEDTEVVDTAVAGVVADTEEGQHRRRSPQDRLTRRMVGRRRRPRRSLRHTVSSLPAALTHDKLD